MPDSSIVLRTRSDLSGIQSLDRAYTGLVTSEQAAAQAASSLAQSFARLQSSAGTQSVEQVISSLRQITTAAGASEGKLLELAGVLSRQALAAGDAARAEQLLAVAMGQQGQAGAGANAQALQTARIEAGLALALRDRAGAARLIATALSEQSDRSTAVIRAETQLARIEEQTAQAARRAADETLRLAQARARAQAAAGDRGGGAATLATAIQQAGSASETAILRAQTQLNQFNQSLIAGGSLAQQFGTSLKTSLVGIIGPAALVAGTFAAARGAIQSFGDAFKFKAELDLTNASITTLLGSVRSSGQIFSEARQFADRFKLTQQETAEAILSSNQIIRQSKAPIDEVLTTLARLRILNPAQDFAGAARALSELNAGQIVSIVNRFNISRTAANEMKKEIQGGADAVLVLSRFLDAAGVSIQALENQTKGATGAMRDLARAQEDLKIAQAGFAQGPGLTILEGQIRSTSGLTRILSGDFDTARASIAQFGSQGGLGIKLIAPLAEGFVSVSEAVSGLINKDPATAIRGLLGAIGEGTPQIQLFTGLTDAIDSVGRSVASFAGIQLPDNFAPLRDSLREYLQLLGLLPPAQNQVTTATGANASAAKSAAVAASSYAQRLTEQQEAQAKATEGLLEDIEKKREAEAATRLLTAVQKTLAELGPKVAGGLISAAEGASILEREYGFAHGAALLLIEDQVRLARVTQATDVLLASQKAATTALALPGGVGAGAPAFAAGVNNSVDAVVALQAANEEAAKAQRDLALATADGAGQLKILQGELATLTPGTAAYANKQKEISAAQKQATADAKALLDSQIALAAAEGNTGKQITLLQQQLSGLTRGSKEYNEVQARIVSLQKGGRGGKGLGTSDRADLALSQAGLEGVTRLQARLDEVKKKLESAKLTETQRKQLAAEKLELERKIGDEIERQADAALDAQILAIKDRQERRQEQRELEGARRRLASGEFTEEEKAGAADVAALIPLEQEKRRREIEQKARAGGLDIAAAAAAPQAPPQGPITIPPAAIPPQAPQVPQAGQAATLILQLDSKQVGSILIPDLIAALKSGLMPVAAAGG